MSQPKTKLVIIGAGPGGYSAAFHAADLGMDVTLIDRSPTLGGVCLNRGCIPSKALLHAAAVMTDAQNAQHYGVTFPPPQIDLAKLREWKNKIVSKLTGGLNLLAKQRNVRFVQGEASFIDPSNLRVKLSSGETEPLAFDKCIIATGSRSTGLPFAPLSERVIDSTQALELENIPGRLLVIGGGYIGLELGSVYQALGSQVSVVEMTPSLLPGIDADLSTVLYRRLKRIFADIKLNTKVAGVQETAGSVSVTFQTTDGKPLTEEYDQVLIAIGRAPASDGLGLEHTAVNVMNNGFIQVDAHRRTQDHNIYAIGDVAGHPMLAHKAAREGQVAVDAICGKDVIFHPRAIPSVIYTLPEIAVCGIKKSHAKNKNLNIKTVKFPWAANGRALTNEASDGFTKLLIDPNNEHILGVAIVGPNAGELIGEGLLAVETGLSVSELKKCIHPHPTLSESYLEAAEMFSGQAVHLYKPLDK